MDVLTDFPERLEEGSLLYAGSEYTPLRLKKTRWHGQALLLSLDGYATPEAVGELRNQIVYVPTAGRPALEEGEYYHHQLLGLLVVDEDENPLGVLSGILETGANDVYVVKPEQGREILLPAIDSVVLDINLAAGEMRVHLLPGILPDE